MNNYSIEVTDTFAGEANYAWVRRYIVKARSIRGAANWLSRNYGGTWRINWSDGMQARYDMRGACVCAFITWTEAE